MLDRNFLIRELIRYELQCLIENPDLLEENIEFFFDNGFSKWKTEALQKKYELFVKEDKDA